MSKMTEIIELSSDDDNFTQNSINSNSSNDTINTDIINIINKYKNETKDTINHPQKTINFDSSDEEISDIKSLQEKLRMKYDLPSTSSNPIQERISSSSSEDEIVNNKITSKNDNLEFNTFFSEENASKPKRRKQTNSEEKQLKKLENQREKAQKQLEKQRIRDEKAKIKAEKQALASAYKNLKPGECIKFMFATVDSDLLSTEYGSDIPNALQAAGINYKINSNLHPFTVTWKRNNQAQLSSIDGQLKVLNNNEECDEILLIILWNKFITLINENNLTSNFKDIQSIFPQKKIYLGIYGLQNYFRVQKSQKQKHSAKDKIFSEAPKVSRQTIDMSLIELQLLHGVSNRFLETPEDVSSIVVQFSKSISQIPFKLHKQLKQQQIDWFIAGDNKDCVKVDKNGNGLHRLWQQQLMQFSLVRLETAEAICSKYPSPSTLMKAYDDCKTIEEGEKLLQDIPIRRAAGPLTSVRKIGPELSKKIYTLFTSTNGNIFL